MKEYLMVKLEKLEAKGIVAEEDVKIAEYKSELVKRKSAKAEKEIK